MCRRQAYRHTNRLVEFQVVKTPHGKFFGTSQLEGQLTSFGTVVQKQWGKSIRWKLCYKWTCQSMKDGENTLPVIHVGKDTNAMDRIKNSKISFSMNIFNGLLLYSAQQPLHNLVLHFADLRRLPVNNLCIAFRTISNGNV